MGFAMLAALVLAAGMPAWADEQPSQIMVRISTVQTAYRNCIADTVAGQPAAATNDGALAVALERCHEAEMVLRAEMQKFAVQQRFRYPGDCA